MRGSRNKSAFTLVLRPTPFALPPSRCCAFRAGCAVGARGALFAVFSLRSSVVSWFWCLLSLLDAALVFCVPHLSALRTWSDIRFHGSRKNALATWQVTSSHTIAELIAWSFLPVLAKLGSLWSGGVATEPGNALVDGMLLGRPRSYSGNSQEWNAFKFVFKAYVGVVRSCCTRDTHSDGSCRAVGRTDNAQWTLWGRQKSLMMNVDEQNGLEEWRLLVRSQQPVTGVNRTLTSHPTVLVLSGLWQAGRRT